MGTWVVTDTEGANHGAQIGFVEVTPNRKIHVQLDGDLAPEVAERVRSYLAAAINEARA